ncbi:MAG TPA: hypothetical protein VM889_06640, partial [Candidatus Thermoplasmatota archaeon]|nr:hypothetical protein [Candidatus Thermoplasmatota archaeon]
MILVDHLVLETRSLLDLAGALRPDASSVPGASIELTSTGLIRVSGILEAAPGFEGRDVSGGVTPVVGMPGERGGSVSIVAATLLLEPTGLIASGRGGNGGEARLRVADPREGDLYEAVGGPAGRGGDVRIPYFTQVSILGAIRLGDGGTGGSALQYSDFTGTWNDRHVAVAVGGAGGDHGSLVLPPGNDPAALILAGLVRGGVGGDGGEARAYGPAWRGEGGLVEADRSVPLCRGENATEPGAIPGAGCDAGAAYAWAGAGGHGIEAGGAGGAAEAATATGGRGGNGATALSTQDRRVPATDGARGGDAGSAQAVAGAGGAAVFTGGAGGSAAIWMGRGG